MRTHTTEQRRRYHANYMAKPENRTKRKAREVCADAIRVGKLVRQACEACGAAKTEAHHDDYSKPLAVRWLCRKCHSAIHRGTPRKSAALRALKNQCQRGHHMTGHNIRISVEGGWERRRCRQCHTDATGRRRTKLT